jgi:hypothetical protein
MCLLANSSGCVVPAHISDSYEAGSEAWLSLMYVCFDVPTASLRTPNKPSSGGSIASLQPCLRQVVPAQSLTRLAKLASQPDAASLVSSQHISLLHSYSPSPSLLQIGNGKTCQSIANQC